MRVLVVHKESQLVRARRRRGGTPRDADTRLRWIQSDVETRRAVTEVIECLARTGWEVEIRARGDACEPDRFDLVVVVGGDGTLFDVARRVRRAPVLAVNPDPARSLSLFSCATARDFAIRLDEFRRGQLREAALNRMEVRVEGRALGPAMNDVLFAHENPAAMARYEIDVDGQRELQRSSGVWVSTAAGSTAGVRAAGGRRMPITSHQLQVRAREPYRWEGGRYALSSAFARREVGLTPRMGGAAIWIDGAREKVALGEGERVSLQTPGPPIRIVGYDDRRRRKLFPA